MLARISLALTATLTLTATASAQYYGRNAVCNEIRNDRGTAGAALGGLIGGVIGGDLAADGVTTEGIIVGAAIGALVGNELGEDTIDCGPSFGRGGSAQLVHHRGHGRHGRGYHGRGYRGYGHHGHAPRGHTSFRFGYHGPRYGHFRHRPHWSRHGRGYGHRGYRGYGHHYGHRGHHFGGRKSGGVHYSFSYSAPHYGRVQQPTYVDPALQYGYFGNWQEAYPYDGQGSSNLNDELLGGPQILSAPNAQGQGLGQEQGFTQNQGGFSPAIQSQPQCQNVQRQTQLPNGQIVTETLRACLNTNGQWVLQ